LAAKTVTMTFATLAAISAFAFAIAFVARVFAQPAGVIAGQQAAQAAIQSAVQQARDRAMSQNAPNYVGAARRTTRRPPSRPHDSGASAPGCIQTVDAYGRIAHRCP
jgi:hypothetical protein